MTTSTPTKSAGFLAHVEGLRAIAVLMVVTFHFGVSELAGGFVGVDIFFVISGFLITRNLISEAKRGPVSIAHFYLKRARRLAPALICTVVVTLLCSALILSPHHFASTGKSAFYTALSVSNVHFWLEAGYFDVSSAFKPLLHTWSLAVEEQFYITWPWILLYLLRSGNERRVIIGLATLTTVSLFASQLLLASFDSAAYFLMPFRAYELIIGALCAYAVAAVRTIGLTQRWGAWVGLILILCAAFSFNEETPFPGITALIPTLGAALVILYSRTSLIGRVLGSAPLVHVGRISYSLYLVHWPLVVLYSYWLGRELTSSDTFILLAAAYCLALAQFRLVEQRFRTTGPTTRQKVQRNGIFLGGTLAWLLIVLLFSAAIQKSGGFKQRIPEPIRSGLTPSRADRQSLCSHYRRVGEYVEECELGQRLGATQSILMFGDSHAEHLVVGMSELAIRRSFYIESHTHSGCPPLWDVTRAFNQPGSGGVKRQKSCLRATNNWKTIVEQTRPDVVILAARWMNLFEDTTYGPTTIRREYLIDEYGNELSQEKSRRHFSSALARTVEHIQSMGSKVILVNQVPLAARNLQDCAAVPRLLYSSANIESRCKPGVNRVTALERMRYMRATLNSLASKDVLSFDATPYFCAINLTYCITMLEGRPLYRDDNHLTSYGSLVFVRSMGNQLSQLLTQE